ncbi:SDR family oxidoreductase [Gloeocapsopsis crepidinum LEGE 06123]|uniref:SDR family oxidoreductase n=1 Tax=Gloeocapsopsis crepidinum LEGE 06123 TaxID=588587 RepID=A0ABR9UTU4_9CHRO|nr:SDR family oxidoreductase [Gloeocapsopsis crepidinum]MBE9191714.1 SDR family oxidoreductase [Gloeocapsopsis crepidinum LEGE 06123]
MNSKILVTGATGNVGSEVVCLLHDRGYQIKAAVRDLKNIDDTLTPQVEYVIFDFQQQNTFSPALQGVSKLFLVRPPAIAQVKRYINPAIDAAIAAGVQHIVFLSLLGTEYNPIVPHAKIESYIKSVGISYTFLRASFFMQNLSTMHQEDIKHQEIFVPAGKGKTSFIDVRDIASVAVKALTEPGYNNQSYALTGDEALDYYQVADMFTRVLGKTVVYTNPSIFQFFTRMYKQGFSLQFIAVMIAIYTTARLGFAARITADLEQILHRKPIRMQQFIADYRECW